MGANEYSVLLKARLDTSEVAKDIAKLQSEIDKASVSSAGGKGKKSPVVERMKQEFKAAEFKISPTFDKSKIDKVMNEIQVKSGKWESTSIRSGFDENGIQKAVSATVKWRDEAGNAYSEFVKLDNSIKGTVTSTQKAASAQKTLGSEMSAVIRRTLESAATLGLMYGALNQIRMGVQYIKDLDKELTNVQVVTGMSEESVQNLALGYNNLAKEMGVSTLEVAKGIFHTCSFKIS